MSKPLDNPDAFSKMSDSEIQAWIREALTLPSNFGSSDDRFRHCEPDRVWALGPVIRHRDSGILDQSNAAALVSMLESDPTLEGQWEVYGASHWAAGWVDHIAFVAVDDGQPSRVARVIKGHFDALSDYPIADESDYCEREQDALYENVGNHWLHGMLISDLPDDWAGEIIGYLNEHDPGALENRDDQGGCPDDSEFERAARALGYWDTSGDETE